MLARLYLIEYLNCVLNLTPNPWKVYLSQLDILQTLFISLDGGQWLTATFLI